MEDFLAQVQDRFWQNASPEFIAAWLAGVPMDITTEQSGDTYTVRAKTKSKCGFTTMPNGDRVLVVLPED